VKAIVFELVTIKRALEIKYKVRIALICLVFSPEAKGEFRNFV